MARADKKPRRSVDGSNTSADWQLNESGIAVWPIAAFEQHGHHLPLSTDNIQAGYFSKWLADELGAALLPLQPFGTSLEHAGFRGTISLTPALLMGLVEQMAAELEAQEFSTLIIMNGHGGNFSLGPKAREINRANRGIKLLLVDIFMHYPWAEGTGKEIHAGELETSIMLALAPQLVGDDRRDGSPSAEGRFVQADLNSFGVGRMNPSGVWGYPSKANAALGRKALAAVKKSLLPWVRQRLDRWQEDRRYGGPGPVAIRAFRPEDTDFGMRLVEACRWNQLPADWDLLTAGGEGCFVAVRNGRPVGTVTTLNYGGRFHWIGMLLTDPECRRLGAGSALLGAALGAAGPGAWVRLDATPAGRELYTALGFREESRLTRYERFAAELAADSSRGCRRLPATALSTIVRYDTPIFGAKRDRVLRYLHGNAKEYAFAAWKGKSCRGYCLGRHGNRFEHVGPVVADSIDVARDLLQAALNRCADRDAIIDIPDEQREWRRFVEELGFAPQRPFIRMAVGAAGDRGQPERQYAIAGPELA